MIIIEQLGAIKIIESPDITKCLTNLTSLFFLFSVCVDRFLKRNFINNIYKKMNLIKTS